EVRFVARGTATYAVLLGYCLQPDQLRNAIDRDQMLDSLWLDALQRTRLIRLIPAEVRDIQNGDVPVFTSRPNSRDLWTSEGNRMRRRRSCVASSSPTEAAADWPARTDRSRLRGWRQALPRRSGKRIRRQLDRNCACGARTFDFNSARGFRIVRGAFRVCVVS